MLVKIRQSKYLELNHYIKKLKERHVHFKITFIGHCLALEFKHQRDLDLAISIPSFKELLSK